MTLRPRYGDIGRFHGTCAQVVPLALRTFGIILHLHSRLYEYVLEWSRCAWGIAAIIDLL